MKHDHAAHMKAAAVADSARPEPRARTWFAACGSFLAAVLATSHHSIHVGLAALGIGVGASLLSDSVRGALLWASLLSSVAIAAWMLRSKTMDPFRFWGLATSVILSAGFLSYGVMRYGF